MENPGVSRKPFEIFEQCSAPSKELVAIAATDECKRLLKPIESSVRLSVCDAIRKVKIAQTGREVTIQCHQERAPKGPALIAIAAVQKHGAFAEQQHFKNLSFPRLCKFHVR
jgi:hypothetical protein